MTDTGDQDAPGVATVAAQLQQQARIGDPHANMRRLDKTQVDVSGAKTSAAEVDSFDALNLKPELLRGIASMNWVKPSPIQAKALPLLLVPKPQNLIAQAPAGTGKTAAFVLTMLNHIDTSKAFPQAVCICPTRELARQNADVTLRLGKFTDAKVCLALPDTMNGVESLRDHVVIGTPGTLHSLLRKRILDMARVAVVVIDEADEMIKQSEALDGGRGGGGRGGRGRRGRGGGGRAAAAAAATSLGVTTSKIVSFVNRATCHIMLFSATFPAEVRQYAITVASPDPFKITVRTAALSLPHIKHFRLACPDDASKFEVMRALFKIMNVGQSIVFVNTRKRAIELHERLEIHGHKVSLIHGQLDAVERDAIVERFRKQKTTVLVSTDLLNRGFDVPEVMCVVNYDIPTLDGRANSESYYHRTGRAGRFGRAGIAVNLIGRADEGAAFSEIAAMFAITPIEVQARSEEELFEFLRPYVADDDDADAEDSADADDKAAAAAAPSST